MRRIPKWFFVAAPLGFAIFIAIGGEVVMLLWNSLAPALFGLRLISFWQALGLLALCRILFGGFGMGGGGRRHNSRGRMHAKTAKRWDDMTPGEQEAFRQGLNDRGGPTAPLNSRPTTERA
ncbi:MAG: hypothetical protein QOE77_3370 [Blastocatellia bacterium]|jgi:hypothetical protein|nr:hypothetical protein [Blastocatellia bacterium]